MEQNRIPKPGELYHHFKDKLYQIITIATHTETGEQMAVYQALYGDFKTYVRPLSMFLSEVDRNKYPESKQKYRFELHSLDGISRKKTEVSNIEADVNERKADQQVFAEDTGTEIPTTSEDSVNEILLKFLDADLYTKKLDVIISNRKHMTDRLINDMAVALDCAVEEGPIDERIKELMLCLQAMCRFEDRRGR